MRSFLIKCALIGTVLTGLLEPWALAKKHVLIISGGGDPALNKHSQYLQTKTLTEDLYRRFGKSRVDVFFGAGNDSRKPPVFPDVSIHPRNGKGQNPRVIHGVIDGNRPATQEKLDSYMAEELPDRRLRQGDVLYLFVSDHGMRNLDAEGYDNNCINLWAYEPGSEKQADWDLVCLSVQELMKMLKGSLKGAQVMFSMSQCTSGGFHRMSVRDESGYPEADPNVCGFASAPENAKASGCTNDVDGDYAGYERYFTEEIAGADLVSGKRLPPGPKNSPREAHKAALARDATVDMPLSTTDYFLQQWYYAIWRDDFKPRSSGPALEEVRKSLDDVTELKWGEGKILSASGPLRPLVADKLGELKSVIALAARNHPEARQLFENGGNETLESEISRIQNELGKFDRSYAKLREKFWKTKYSKLLTPWLEKGRVSVLTPKETDYDDVLSALEKNLKGHLKTESELVRSFTLDLADVTASDPAEADQYAAYYRQRDEKMYGWALASKNQGLRNAVRRLQEWSRATEALDRDMSLLDKKLSRFRGILQRRQQIAAAVGLSLMGDEKAAKQGIGLMACEKTGL